MEMIQALRSKNRCLRKLLQISEAFLADLQNGNFSQVTHYESQWDPIFKIMALCDQQTTQQSLHFSTHPELITEQTLIQKLIYNNQQIILHIETELQNLKQSLHRSDKHQNQFLKFKSKWLKEHGERLDISYE